MRTRLVTWFVLAVFAVLPPGGHARPIGEGGRDPAKWAPDRHFDHLHMRLEIDIPDMERPYFTAVQTLRVTPIGTGRSELVLHATGLDVTGVRSGGRDLKFTSADGLLTVRFARPVPLGSTVEVMTRYSCEPKSVMGAGLTWTQGKPNARSATDRVPQIHSQGQPESNHLWFPCHDSPNERLTTELIVTVQDGFQVCSNGRLIDAKRAGPGRTRWHWLQDRAHANYLVVLVVGKFSIVGLEAPEGVPGTDVPVMLYVPIGAEKSGRAAYARTPEMIAYFERIFDEPYPWDKYAQLCVRNFAAGGMENTSATTLQASSASAPAGSQDDIIAHELAHQWTGDLLTCKTWAHTWLNEGWASYAEALWAEHAAGPERARKSYQRRMARFAAGQRAFNSTTAPMFEPMVSNRYAQPFENFIKPNDVYAKGAMVLHMLRMRLGDEAFFKGVRLYIDRFRFQCVETDDFRRAMEDASGESLERFFTQWCYRPGLPRLRVTHDWAGPEQGSDGPARLRLIVEQTQQIDPYNPAYALTLPVVVTLADGTERRGTLESAERRTEAVWEFPAGTQGPADIVIDPDMTITAPVTVKKPTAMWLHQLEHGPTIFARMQAAEALAQMDDPGAGRALDAVTGDDDELVLIRQSAAGARLERVVVSNGGAR